MGARGGGAIQPPGILKITISGTKKIIFGQNHSIFGQAMEKIFAVQETSSLPNETGPVHSKNTWVSAWPGKRVHWGQTPFRVNNDPEIGQLSADLTNNGVRLTQLWVICRVKLTDFRVIVDPEWSLAQWTLSGSSFDPDVFRVYAYGTAWLSFHKDDTLLDCSVLRALILFCFSCFYIRYPGLRIDLVITLSFEIGWDYLYVLKIKIL